MYGTVKCERLDLLDGYRRIITLVFNIQQHGNQHGNQHQIMWNTGWTLHHAQSALFLRIYLYVYAHSALFLRIYLYGENK